MGNIVAVVAKLLNPEGAKISKREWQWLFEDVYAISNLPSVEEILPVFTRRISDMLKEHVEHDLKTIEGSSREAFLKTYRKRFNTFCSGVEYTDIGFSSLYSDGEGANHCGVPTPPRPKAKTQAEVGMAFWRDIIFSRFKAEVAEEVHAVVLADRAGDVADITSANEVVASLIKMCASDDPDQCLPTYRQDLEKGFLEQTRTYYTRESNQFVETKSPAEYLISADQRLKDEVVRSSKILHKSSAGPLDKVLNECFILNHREMIEAEFRSSLESEYLPSLRLAHGLMKRVCIEPLKKAIEKHVIACLTLEVSTLDAASSSTMPIQYAEKLSDMYEKFCRLIKDAFDGELQFMTALDAGCRAVVNRPITIGNAGGPSMHSPDLLAKYCDLCLKRSKHLSSADEIEDKLNALIVIFEFIDDKDIFQKFYAKMLAKRLIHGTSASDEAEASMISKLKQCCGYEYTTKLQQMFTDTTLSHQLNDKFSETEVGKGERAFRVMVLQTGAWPLGGGNKTTLQLPAVLDKSIRAFEVFYHSQHSGRKLNWLHHLSTGDIVFVGDSGRYDFVVTTFQMAILLLYNEADSFSVDAIATGTQLAERELYRTVRSLVATKLLQADPPLDGGSGAIDGAVVIRINMKFKSRKRRVRLSTAVQRETPAETKRTADSIDEDRKSLLQISIVRIMKSRKTLGYRTLIEEVIRMVSARFKPTVIIIKRCIEDLIQMEYLCRAEGDSKVLHYMA